MENINDTISTNSDTFFLNALSENRDKLFRICLSYAQNSDQAKDLFQDSIFAIWRSMSTFRNEASIDTWMYRITINTCYKNNSFESKQNSVITSIDHQKLESVFVEYDDSIISEELIILRQCIQSLNDSERSLITLYLEECSYKQIAEVIGISENHVAVKLKRIRSKLLEMMKEKL